MKLNDIVIGVLVVVSASAVFGWLDERDSRIAMMDKPTMCEVTQYESTHVLPCRIVSEYLAVAKVRM